MFMSLRIFGIILVALVVPNRVLTLSLKYLTCEEFEQGARFDPYELLTSMWKIFYLWADTTEVFPIVFSLPIKQRLQRFKAIVDAVDPHMGVEWEKATFLMEPRPGVVIIMLYAGTPGAYRALITKDRRDTARPYPVPLLKLADVRMKIVDGILGMMCCEDLTAYALARMDEMPLTERDCKSAAAKLGFNEPGGLSYFYIQNITKREIDDEL